MRRGEGEERDDQMGLRAGSSRPEPRPVVPRIMPLMWGRVLRRVISCMMAWGGAERGRVAKA